MSTSQLQSASSLTADVSLSLSRCPTDHYIVILQPDVLPTDFSTPSKVPVLSSKFKDDMNWSNFRLQAAASVSDVVGHIDVNSWREILEDSCGASTYIVDGEPATWQIWDAAKMQTPLVLGINLPSLAGLTGEARDKALRNHDLILGELLKMTSNYTVLYTTSVEPVVQQPEDIESKQYEMETPLDLQHEAMHVELKRNLGESSLQRRANDTLPNGPLFERYQFFTPGMFFPRTLVVRAELTDSRHLYGLSRRFSAVIDLIRGHFRGCKFASHLRCF